MQRCMNGHVGAFVLFAVVAFTLAGSRPAAAQNGFAQSNLPTPANLLQPLGHLGGPAQAAAYQAPYAYVGLGRELAILDLLVPETPVRVGYIQMPESITDVAVAGDFAVVRLPEQTALFDITNPAQPRQLASHALPRSYSSDIAHQLATFDNAIYAAANSDGLLIWDLAEPGQAISTAIQELGGELSSLSISGGILYAADDFQVHSFSLTDPLAPASLGRFALTARSPTIVDLATGHGLVVILLGDGTLHVLDATEPEALQLIGTLELGYDARALAWLDGTLVALMHGWEQPGLLPIDLSQPESPAVGAFTPTASAVWKLAPAGDLELLAAGNSGVQLGRADGQTEIDIISTYGGLATGVPAIANNTLLIPDDERGLQLVDIQDPTSPAMVGAYRPDAPVRHVVGDAHIAYMTVGQDNVHVVEFANPDRPAFRALYHTDGEFTALVLKAAWLFAATSDGVEVIDVSKPGEPTQVDFYPLSNVRQLATVGTRLYALGDELTILDVDTSGKLTAVGAFPNMSALTDLAAAGNLVYFAHPTGNGFQEQVSVFDVTDPRQPVRVYPEPPYEQLLFMGPFHDFRNLAATESHLLVHDALGLHAFNMTETARPVLEGFHSLPWLGSVAVADNGVLYALTGAGELFSFAAAPIPPSQPGGQVALVGHAGGLNRAIAVQDGLAFAGIGPELAVLDVDDPTNPQRIGSLVPEQGSTVQAVTVRGAYAYVVDKDYLRVVEITEPEKPVERTTVRLRHGNGAAIALLDDYAIVRTRACSRPGSHTLCGDRLEIYDLVAPVAPAYMATLPLEGSRGFPLYNTLYVDPADGTLLFGDGQRLARLDLTDPGQPDFTPIGDMPAYAISTADDYAYLFSYFGALSVIDLQASSGPTEVFDEAHNRNIVTANVLDDALIACGSEFDAAANVTRHGCWVYDIGVRDRPEELVFWPVNAAVYAAAVQGSTLLLATGAGPLLADLSTPAAPILVGAYAAPARIGEIAASGDQLSVTAPYFGDAPQHTLMLADLIEHANPRFTVAAGDTPGDALAVDGETAFVTNGDELTIFGLHDERSPKILARHEAPGTIEDVVIGDGYAYLLWNMYVENRSGIEIVDVSQPETPAVAGQVDLDTGLGFAHLALADDQLSLLAEPLGLVVYDIAVPTIPQPVLRAPDLRGDTLQATDELIHVIDADDANSPGLLPYLMLSGRGQNLGHTVGALNSGVLGIQRLGDSASILDDRAYVVGANGSLHIVDLGDVTAPTEIGLGFVPGVPGHVAAIGDLIFVSTTDDGLFVYELVAGAKDERPGAYSPSPEFLVDGRWVTRDVDAISLQRSDDGGRTWSPWQAPVAFTSDRDGNRELYVADAEGGVRRVTGHPDDDETPAWSPSWTNLVFQSNRSGNWDIFAIQADCDVQMDAENDICRANQLTSDPGDDLLPAWSPDGRMIAFVSTRDGNPEIYVMDRFGNRQTRLTFDPAGDWRPAWLPDARRLVFASGRSGANDLYVLEVPDPASWTSMAPPEPTRLTDDKFDNRDPAVLDGETILFLSDRSGTFQLYTVSLQTPGLIKALPATGGKIAHPAWSGTGDVLNSQGEGDTTDIYRLSADGYEPVVMGPGFDGHPAGAPTWWNPSYR